MSDIEKIRQEIERLKEEYNEQVSARLISESLVSMGKVEALNKVLAFIDSLPEEKPSEDLEEAAEISFDEARALTEDYRDFLAKGLTENRPRPIGPHWFCEYAKNRFIAGAEWQKEQMMKGAVEAKIYGYDDGSFELIASWLDMPKESKFKDGDKVKIVIVKEDDGLHQTKA